MNPSLPFINGNGTPRESLVKARADAAYALITALNVLTETAPHGRDALNPSHYIEMLEVYRKRYVTIEAIVNEILKEAEEIQA